MKLTDLIKKEAERTNQEIAEPEKVLASKKVFKKERVWLEPETVQKPIENQLSTNNKEINKQPIENQSSKNHQISSNDLKTIAQGFNKPIEIPSTNQSSKNHTEIIKHEPSSLVGNEAVFVNFIVEECVKNGALKTARITTDTLKIKMNLNANGVANLIFRIKEKGLIDIIEQKLGRVSYRVFGVSHEVYTFFNTLENHNTIITKPSGKPSNNASNFGPNSSSSSLDKRDLNTITIAIPTSLAKVISKKEVSDLLEKGLISETDLVFSMEHFAYDYSNNLVRAKNPLNLFFGLTRSGKVYRSLKLIEQENEELREYEASLSLALAENQRLKQTQLQEKYEEYKKANPNFVNSVKNASTFITTDEMADKVAFEKFKESQVSET